MVIKFGTDGWRAIIAEEFTFDNVRLCAQGTANFLKEAGLAPRGLFIGYDTRFASEDFARAVAEVVTANDIKVALASRAAPTPAISYAIATGGFGAGVIITASHNAGRYNGYKFKASYGGTASPEAIGQLEAAITAITPADVKRGSLKAAGSKGLFQEVDPQPAYVEKLTRLVDIAAIRHAGFTVLTDPMYGAGAGYFPAVIGEAPTKVIEIHGERNPLFPGIAQPEPLAHNLGDLMDAVPQLKAHVGLATDGDADRSGLVDEEGKFITTLDAFSLLCFHQLEILGKRGPLVRSITMSSMIDTLAALYKVPVFVEPVGFKYLGPVMMREDALAAGEESGGYAFSGHIPERDGILSGLYLLEMMAKTGKKVSKLREMLLAKVGPHIYNRIDYPFDPAQRDAIFNRVQSASPTSLAGLAVVEIDPRDGFRFVLEHGFWALIRFSGTEPLLRTYAEGDLPERVEQLLQDLRAIVGI
ncbi:MAG: phosphoglucomutase/phosphomannomutase family protein [SAR202 cluster bacterium]|nr:phosphoglucomutase/phosphomannomutase family protein [SAR202 cluster bacterium]